MAPPDERSLDRNHFEVLPAEECWELLGRVPVGRIAFVSYGSPLILPVNFALDGRTIVIRTAVGEKLHAAALGKPVAFEVDGWEDRHRSGWSVLVQGIADEVLDEETIEQYRRLDLKPWADAVERDRWIRIIPEEISGRRLVR